MYALVFFTSRWLSLYYYFCELRLHIIIEITYLCSLKTRMSYYSPGDFVDSFISVYIRAVIRYDHR